jgi:hypothetical protein
MSVPCSDQDFRTTKAKDASLPPGVTAERCWCDHLAKVKQVKDFSNWFGMQIFMCTNYDHDPPQSSSSSSTRQPVYFNRFFFCHICMSLFLWFNVIVCVAISPTPVQVVSLDRHEGAKLDAP